VCGQHYLRMHQAVVRRVVFAAVLKALKLNNA
jgi:hypothetical protein